MNRLDGKPSASSEETFNLESLENATTFNESHQMTLNRPFGSKQGKAEVSSYSSIEYHLTAQITNSSLTRSNLSLILDVLNYQAVSFGVNFNMFLAMYELYFRVLGQKSNSKEVKEGYIRKTLTVSEIIFKTLKNKEFSLDPRMVFYIPGPIKSILRKGLMSKRTYGSRFRYWRPEKFVTIKAVPVDIQFLKRKKDTQPYSGYCKGYGESHPSAHNQKLRPSAEYDGEEVEFGLAEEKFLFQRCTDPIHLLSEYLLIRYHNEIEAE